MDLNNDTLISDNSSEGSVPDIKVTSTDLIQVGEGSPDAEIKLQLPGIRNKINQQSGSIRDDMSFYEPVNKHISIGAESFQIGNS
jgi:hypothetical protein